MSLRVGQIYRGELVLYIIFDIGNTSSAVAYLLLRPGHPVPTIVNVASWPKQKSDFKMPSCVLISEGGEVIKFGKEAILAEGTIKGSELVKNFKLAIHPPHMQNQTAKLKQGNNVYPASFEKPEISKDKLKTIYKAFVRCLLEYTKRAFIASEEDGSEQWPKAIKKAMFTVGVPNGWLEPQKEIIEQALLHSGYCPSVDQITTISEGEASFHFLVNHSSKPIPRDAGVLFMVLDCGGSTVDCNVIELQDSAEKRFKLEQPHCWQRGGWYVTQSFLKYVQDKLRSTGELSQKEISNALKSIEKSFEEQIKTTWEGSDIEDEVLIECGPHGLDAPRAKVTEGKFKISGAELQKIFDCCVNDIVAGVVQIVEDSRPKSKKGGKAKKRKIQVPPKIKHVLLVGGFGESKYLRRRLESALNELGVTLYRPPPSHPGTKGVSVAGAWAHLEDGSIVSRGALFDFGVSYVLHNPEKHQGRPYATQADGKDYMNDVFHPIVRQGQPSRPDQFSPFPFVQTLREAPNLARFGVALYAYTGAGVPDGLVYMRDTTPERRLLPDFTHIGNITWGGDEEEEEADLQAKRCEEEDGTVCWKLDYSIGVAFGGLRIKARIEAADGSSTGAVVTFASVLDE